MTNQTATEAISTKSAAGRKPSVSEDQAAEVVERLHREGRKVTVGAVRAEIGGAPKTIKLLLERIDALPAHIETQPTKLVGLEKMFQQAVQEETVSLRLESQKQIDMIRSLLDQAVALLVDADAERKSATSKLEAVQTERAELHGRLETTSGALENAKAELATTRAEAAAAAKSEAVAKEQLNAALSSSMAAEARLEEERRQHRITQDELARSKLALDASESQATQHLQELVRAEESWAVERRLKDRNCETLYAILEAAAECNVPIRDVLNSVDQQQGFSRSFGPVSKAGSLREFLKQFWDIAERRLSSVHDEQDTGEGAPPIST